MARLVVFFCGLPYTKEGSLAKTETHIQLRTNASEPVPRFDLSSEATGSEFLVFSRSVPWLQQLFLFLWCVRQGMRSAMKSFRISSQDFLVGHLWGWFIG